MIRRKIRAVDRVCDLCRLIVTFDRFSLRSIARAVARFQGQDDMTLPLLTADGFAAQLNKELDRVKLPSGNLTGDEAADTRRAGSRKL